MTSGTKITLGLVLVGLIGGLILAVTTLRRDKEPTSDQSIVESTSDSQNGEQQDLPKETDAQPVKKVTAQDDSKSQDNTVSNAKVAERIFIPTDFPAWAAIKTPDALVRTKSGKATKSNATIRTGIILSVIGPRVSPKLNLYPCHLALPSSASTSRTTVVIYVAAKDLDFHPGDLATIRTQAKQLATKRAQILADIYKLDNLVKTSNPYRRLLTKAQADKAALKKKLPALIAKRDAATAEQRLDANAAIQTVKDQIATLERKEKTLRVSMAEWAESKKNDTSRNAEKAELNENLRTVTAKLTEAMEE